MECPACHAKIGILKNVQFTVRFALKKAMPCPYCNITLYKHSNPTREYFKAILFVIFLIGFVLFLLAIIFGHMVGYKSAFTICFWLWVIAVAVIGAIVLVNLAFILFHKIYTGILDSKDEGRRHDDNTRKSTGNGSQ